MKKTLVENLGDRYKILSGIETASIIENVMKKTDNPLSDKQSMALRNSFGDSGSKGNLDMPFLVYKWKEEDKSSSFPWRLTLPILYMYSIITTILILPIKWLVTGKFHFSQNSKIATFNMKWYNKIYNKHWWE